VGFRAIGWPPLPCCGFVLGVNVQLATLPKHFEMFVVLALLAGAWYAPQFGSVVFGAIERFAARLAAEKSLAICAIAAAAVLLRVSLLWFIPIPVPEIHDEFSYLLAGDTFAHGRLTNPPHPMWVYFDTFHVNQQPTYMSKYPPGQGAVLALGHLLGHPWIGVVLSVAVMCAAILWMLQGWLPPQWALLGGTLVLFRLGIFSYWMNSYWGGAVAATGGAMVVGALPRILHSRHPRDATILGLGAAMLANTRPFEGLILCVPVFVVLIASFARGRGGSWGEGLWRVALPCGGVLLVCGIFMAYYNLRGTGSPWVFPNVLNDRTHFSIPQTIWQKARPPFHFLNPQFDIFYNVWLPSIAWPNGRPDGIKNILLGLFHNGVKLFRFFAGDALSAAFIVTLPWMLFDRRVRFLIVQGAICFGGFLLVAEFLPHYVAPVAATLFALFTQGIRHLRQWRTNDVRRGIGLSRAVFICAVVLQPHTTDVWKGLPIENRARIEAQLDVMPGDDLVVVRYSPQHDVGGEWVYNRADIDKAKVVWAREIPGVDMQPLLSYFHGRKVWLVEPDAVVPALEPYPMASTP
jgi:hypothetical protein